MKVPDPRLNFSLTLLRSIGRAHPGELAEACGTVLVAIARPLAVSISVRLPGLDPDDFSFGARNHLSLIDETLRNYGIADLDSKKKLPGFVSVTTDEGKTICSAVLKHLGNPIGYVAAISSEHDPDVFPLSESVWLCASQLGMRIHAILSPGSPMAAEIMGRRLLRALHDDGVRGLAIRLSSEGGEWTSLYQQDDKLALREIEKVSSVSIVDGETIVPEALGQLWPGIKVEAGEWVKAAGGYDLAIGFADRKLAVPRIADRVRERWKSIVESDTDYLVKSFDKLKADFEKLVKSERAAAITETAITVNHEINNPLTAILGNTQLMLMAKDKLPADVIAKLQTIERSAIKIRETTSKLMSIIEPVTGPYASGLEMIDIEKSKKKKPQ